MEVFVQESESKLTSCVDAQHQAGVMVEEIGEWHDRWERIYAEELLDYKPTSFDAAQPAGDHPFFSDYLFPRRALGPEDKVLEIGCGVGSWLLHLYDKVAEMHGTDISETAIRHAEHLFRNEANVHLHAGTDLEAMFPETRFNLVFAITVFQHLPRWQTKEYLRQSFDLMACDGVLFFNTMSDCGTLKRDATLEDLDPESKVPGVCWSEEDLRGALAAMGYRDVEVKFMRVEHPNAKYGWNVVVAGK